MDFPGRVLAAMIAIILITIFPLQYLAQIFNENTDTCIDDGTRQLVDDIRDKGYLDKPMYEEFMEKLDKTGELYDIEIADIHPISGQIAGLESYNAEHVDANQGSFITTSKPLAAKKLFTPGPTDAADSAFHTFSLATHDHTDTCYVGHRHTSGCNGYVGNRDVPVLAYMNKSFSSAYKTTAISITIMCRRCYKVILTINMSDNEDNSKDTVTSSSQGFVNNKATSVQLYHYRSNQVNLDSIMQKIYTMYDALLPYCTYTDSGGIKWEHPKVCVNLQTDVK